MNGFLKGHLLPGVVGFFLYSRSGLPQLHRYGSSRIKLPTFQEHPQYSDWKSLPRRGWSLRSESGAPHPGSPHAWQYVPDEYVPSNPPSSRRKPMVRTRMKLYMSLKVSIPLPNQVSRSMHVCTSKTVIWYKFFCNTGDQDTGAPREITPQQGDLFAMLEKWIDDPGGNPSIVYQNGSTLVFDAGWPWMGISFPFTRKLSCSKESIFWRKLTRQHRFCRRIGNHIQG